MAGLLTNANYINDTIKPAIKSAIEAQGVTVPSTDSFLDYADRIAEIEGGGGDGYVLQDLPTGSISSFNDGVDLPLNSLKVSIEAVQSGSGTPSPSNVRPITGWDSVDVDVVGKNLIDESQFVNGANYFGPTGDIISAYNVKVLTIPIKAGTYTVVWESEFNNKYCRVNMLDASRNWISRILTSDNSPQTFTIISDGYLQFANQTTSNYCMLQLGTTATTYEPYQGKTTTIPLSSTCYGGELDVTSGELKVTHGNIASYNGETLPSTWISSMDEYTAGGTPTTGAQVVYELATPTTIQVQPTAIRTLEGVNNLWADCGDVIEGEYFSGNIPDGLALDLTNVVNGTSTSGGLNRTDTISTAGEYVVIMAHATSTGRTNTLTYNGACTVKHSYRGTSNQVHIDVIEVTGTATVTMYSDDPSDWVSYAIVKIDNIKSLGNVLYEQYYNQDNNIITVNKSSFATPSKDYMFVAVYGSSSLDNGSYYDIKIADVAPPSAGVSTGTKHPMVYNPMFTQILETNYNFGGIFIIHKNDLASISIKSSNKSTMCVFAMEVS